MANNTGNPVGSTAAKDLSDNAANLDKFSIGAEHEYKDRLGYNRKSLKGMEADLLRVPGSIQNESQSSWCPTDARQWRRQLLPRMAEYQE